MSDTPRTREEWRRIQRRPDGRYGSEITHEDLAHGMSNFAKQLERELGEALSDLEFRRDLFKLQEQQLNDVRAERDEARETAERYRFQANAMMMQRDRLAEALRMITTFDYSDLQCDNGHGARFVAAEALRSLTPNEL